MRVEAINRKEIKEYLLRGGAWALFGKTTNALSGLVLAGLLARLLAPADMGVYFLAFNLATFFSILGRAGLEHTLTRFIAQAHGSGQWGRLHSIYTKGTLLVLVGAGTAGLLTAVCVPALGLRLFNFPKLSAVSWLVGGWASLLAIQFTMGEVFRGYQKIGTSVCVSGLVTATLSVALLGVFSAISNHLVVVQVFVLVLVALSINNVIALILQHRLIRHRPNELGAPIEYRELFFHAWPLLVNAITTFILAQSDLWLLGVFSDEKDVAIYGAASRLVMLTAAPLAIVNMIVPPLIARMHEQNDMTTLERLLRSAAAMTGLPALVVLTIFAFLGAPILRMVYGSFYETGSVILIILCAAQVVNVLVGSCGYVLIMTGHKKTIMIISIASAIIALLLGFSLVQTHGAIGLAFAYATAIIAQQVATWLIVRWKCGIWTHAAFSEISTLFSRSARKTKMLRVPDIYIVGAQKSGTTTLYDWLAQHPQIYAHPFAKDYPYFSDPRARENGTSLFCSFVEKAPENCITLGGDANAMYAHDGAQGMHLLMPEARLVAILRNPVERAYSAYTYAVERLMEDRTFEQAIQDELRGRNYEPRDALQRDYIGHGCYAAQLDALFLCYPPDRVKIIILEELKDTPNKVLKDLFSWIGVADDFLPDLSVQNETKGGYKYRWMPTLIHGRLEFGKLRRPLKTLIPYALRRSTRYAIESFGRVHREKPEFSVETKNTLKEYYLKEIEAIEKILGRKIDAWHI